MLSVYERSNENNDTDHLRNVIVSTDNDYTFSSEI